MMGMPKVNLVCNSFCKCHRQECTRGTVLHVVTEINPQEYKQRNSVKVEFEFKASPRDAI
jgi:hypothetical protein